MYFAIYKISKIWILLHHQSRLPHFYLLTLGCEQLYMFWLANKSVWNYGNCTLTAPCTKTAILKPLIMEPGPKTSCSSLCAPSCVCIKIKNASLEPTAKVAFKLCIRQKHTLPLPFRPLNCCPSESCSRACADHLKLKVLFTCKFKLHCLCNSIKLEAVKLTCSHFEGSRD